MRSVLVFSKVNSRADVGVVAWIPSRSAALPWWRSSDRARELLEETAGYLYEALLNSGRGSNSPVEGASADFGQHPSSAKRVAAPSLR